MNEQAEYMLLGSILKDNSILGEISLTPEHFEDLTNQKIFQAMQNVKKKGYPIDGASLKDDMGDGAFLFVGGNTRLQELKNTVPSVHGFKSYEKMVLNQWKLEKSKESITATLDNLSLDKVQELIKNLSKIEQEGVQEQFNLSEHLSQMYDLATVETPPGRSGIPSGFVALDNKTDGFQENDLVIVGARPSMGKTAFALNMALNAGSTGAIPVIFSLEMSASSLIKRMLSRLSEVNGMKLKNLYQYTDQEEKDRWIEALGKLEKIDLKIFDNSKQKVSEMRANLRKIQHDNPGRKIIVMIDYLTLIRPAQDHKGNTHAQVTEISADLKAMAKDFKCPVICLAQLSRGVEARQDKRPLMSDLRESGSIEQDADIIMLLYRDEYYNETTDENRDRLEVDIAKNRDGEVGDIKLMYKKEINKIENLYHYHDK
ncbi:replicative DNA helicase [Metabacillus sp. GX 13764]|uniref:replicative DNA helicase n=1 Tax=Metabacillus kandeliae TaxID=2900151 RepID=UPI001E47A0B3|nr:replicative DNA helicase [Metabacillus kandeliae]MCD7034331.1 replicative DNA helicase [Metabacillus kandeliae]